MSTPVHSLFITLKRSFAGTREHHVRILQSLGLRYRQQTVQQPNKAHIRGAIDKVRWRLWEGLLMRGFGRLPDHLQRLPRRCSGGAGIRSMPLPVRLDWEPPHEPAMPSSRSLCMLRAIAACSRLMHPPVRAPWPCAPARCGTCSLWKQMCSEQRG